MKNGRQLLRWTGVLLSTLVILTGCTYDAAIQRLSPTEQAEFFTYQRVMTGAHVHTYLAKATAAERTAYLSEIDLAQRFQALDSLDQEAVKRGWPRVGMSAEALRFVWGHPSYTAGDARHYAHWHYLGSSFNRTYNYHPWDGGIGSMSISSLGRSWGGWMRSPMTMGIVVRQDRDRLCGANAVA